MTDRTDEHDEDEAFDSWWSVDAPTHWTDQQRHAARAAWRAALAAAQPETDLLREAADRIEDMLKADDGQAWKEARKTLAKLRAAAQPAVQAEPTGPCGYEKCAAGHVPGCSMYRGYSQQAEPVRPVALPAATERTGGPRRSDRPAAAQAVPPHTGNARVQRLRG